MGTATGTAPTATTATTTRTPRWTARQVRAAKDKPGRHGDNYGGPGKSDEPVPVKTVTASQGERSFAARSARKRPV